MSAWTQLGLLLWKNFTYRRRQTLQLLVEILWPLFIFFILIAVRVNYPPYEQHECHFPNKAMPSAGTLPWIQGILCNANNPCFRSPTPGESPGVVGNFNDSIISRLFSDAKKILLYSQNDKNLEGFKELSSALRELQESRTGFQLRHFLQENETLSHFLKNNASLPQSSVDHILSAPVNLNQILLKGFGVHLTDLCPSKPRSRNLSEYITISDPALQSELTDKICTAPPSWLQAAEQLFLQNLDFFRPVKQQKSGMTSDPEAVNRVAVATNNLLDTMGLLAVEFADVTGVVCLLRCQPTLLIAGLRHSHNFHDLGDDRTWCFQFLKLAPKRKPQVSSLADGEENGYGGAEALCDDPQTPSMADIANLLQGLVRRQTEHDARWEQEKLQQENRWQSMERRVDQLQQEVKAERPDTPPVVVGAAPAAQAESPNVPAMNVDSCDAQEQRSKTVIGIYANLSNDDTPEDVGVIIEGVTVLQELAVLGLAALGLARTGPQRTGPRGTGPRWYWAPPYWASSYCALPH
uniref:Uncharacterized protein n=1 Tax=Knipowitschia caucasica TaxID=637954 RepID=A0AAV2KA90_KNICA